MKKSFLIVGLGNPEGKYFQTYHNAGFLCLDALADRLGAEFKKKGNQSLATCQVGEINCLLLKPLTYMNRSGEAVMAAIRKHKVEPAQIIVFADDLYINKGNIRISFGGSHGGHNGIRSINELLGTNQYTKIKIGIAPEKPPHSMPDYVLSRISALSRPFINDAIDKAVDTVMGIMGGEPIEKMQSIYNTKNTNISATGGEND